MVRYLNIRYFNCSQNHMTTRHPNSRSFLAKGLFDDLDCFSTIEARISALPSNKERGDAFEVFAEAYLATQKIALASEVWAKDIPFDQRQRFGLPLTDKGIDPRLSIREI